MISEFPIDKKNSKLKMHKGTGKEDHFYLQQHLPQSHYYVVQLEGQLVHWVGLSDVVHAMLPVHVVVQYHFPHGNMQEEAPLVYQVEHKGVELLLQRHNTHCKRLNSRTMT